MKKNPLLAWRERLELTQRGAAESLGCGRRSLQVWETGRPASIPRYILLAAAAIERKLKPVI